VAGKLALDDAAGEGPVMPAGRGADVLWIDQHRRISKDSVRATEPSGALIYIASTRPMLRRLAAA
jgi:hypothetical protein